MKKLLPWVVVALVIRILLMGYSIHPDFRAVNLAGYLIAQKGEVFSFYDHISKLPRDSHIVKLYGDDLFIYPPLAYLFHAISYGVFSPMYPNQAFETLINDIGSIRNVQNYPLFIFLLKIPYLIVDVFCLYLIRKLVSEKNRLKVSIFWLFNPVNIYVTYMIGQFDIFLCVFILAALVYKKISPFLIGIAAGFKPFPLFLLPLLPGNKIKNIAIGLCTYIVILLPYIASPAFKQYALFASLSDKIMFAKILVSGSQYLSLFFVVLVLLYWLNSRKSERFSIIEWFSSIFLLFYAVTNFHPQWFLWAMPLVTILVIENKKRLLPALVLLGCYVCIVFSFEPSLNVGLFGVQLDISKIVGKFYPVDQLVSILRSVLVGTSVAFLLQPDDSKLRS